MTEEPVRREHSDVPTSRREGGGQSVESNRDGNRDLRARQAAESAPPIDAAQALFNRYRKAAEERGDRRLRRPPKNTSLTSNPRAASRTAQAEMVPGNRSGAPRTDLRDPKPLSETLKTLVRSRGWTAPVAVGSVISRWEQLVGSSIAEHCRPERFEDGVVTVICDSTAWATNLKLMKIKLMEVFERELGKGIVTEIDIRGPAAPSWKRGRYSVRGGRGPRDTYG
ncbi:DUF721 domain-containing protein [Nesterenkonia ebinurensis]|uniref:DUF721 domain-containing protein n=1 Tax=Nesterenkonia ebinurensis TaxID=2608252 RepID=UPI001CC5AD53|nr:DciA family protein [Nesterenkonia ebinurensis]